MIKEYKKKFGKFEKAGNGNYKCPVCKRSMWTKEEGVAKHALKCKGRSTTKKVDSNGTSTIVKDISKRTIKKLSDDKTKLKKYKSDLKTAEECLRTAKDKTVITKTKDRIRYLTKRIEELK